MTTPSLSAEALFRYRVLSEVGALSRAGYSRTAAVRAVADSPIEDVDGHRRTVSARTVWRWLSRFDGTPQSLEPRWSAYTGSRALDETFLTFLTEQLTCDPAASIPEVIRRARQQEVLRPDEAICRTTVWRAAHLLGLPTDRRSPSKRDRARRFAFPHRMQLVMADFVHFRAGPTRAKRCAVYLLDDCSRMGLAVEVATSERPEAFLRAILRMVRRYGLPDALYADGGSGFVAHDVAAALAHLQIGHIPSTPRYPQARGKVERFNRSLRARLLRTLPGNDDVDANCASLTLRLSHDLRCIYNHLPHRAHEGQSPKEVFEADERDLQPALSEEWLSEAFVVDEERTVSADHVISYEGTLYEVPDGLRGQRITVHRHLLKDDALSIDHDGERVWLKEVDVADNATSGRPPAPSPNEEATEATTTASTHHFSTTYQSLLDADGGYSDPEPNDEEDLHDNR